MIEHPPLEISVRESDGVHLLHVRGRLTIGDASKRLTDAFQAIAQNGGRKVIINLDGVPQIDSSGLSSLVLMSLQLARAGGGLHLVCGPGRVRDALTVTRLLEAIPTFETDAAAAVGFS